MKQPTCLLCKIDNVRNTFIKTHRASDFGMFKALVSKLNVAISDAGYFDKHACKHAGMTDAELMSEIVTVNTQVETKQRAEVLIHTQWEIPNDHKRVTNAFGWSNGNV